MGDEVFRSSRGKTAGFFALSLAFVAIGVWLIVREPGDWRAIACVAFFGLGLLVFGAQLANPSTLTLGRDSFTYKGLLGRGFTVPWDEVESFHVWKNPTAAQTMVAWTYRPVKEKTSIAGRMASGLGADGAIPGLWPISSADLAEQMSLRLRLRTRT